MLILTMREEDRVLIPSLNIVVKLTNIRGNKVRVGFDAPKDVAIFREAVLHKLETQTQNQTQTKPNQQ